MQTTECEVTMVQPLKDAVTRRLFGTKLPDVVSQRQLAGYLTHILFADSERGGEGTIYHVTTKRYGTPQVFSVRRTLDGRYVHV